MKGIVFITPEDVRYGFMLTGVSQHIIREGNIIDELNEIIRIKDIGFIVIDERLLKDKDIEYLREIERRWEGIILVLPAPMKPTIEAEDYAIRLIKKAIGYHVRLSA